MRTISHPINRIFESASQKIRFQDWVRAYVTFWKSQFCLFSSLLFTLKHRQLWIFKSGSFAELSDLTPTSLVVLQIFSETRLFLCICFSFSSSCQLVSFPLCPLHLLISSLFFSSCVSLWECCMKVTSSCPFIFKCTSVSYKLAATAGWGHV